jgi:hypothetical protein
VDYRNSGYPAYLAEAQELIADRLFEAPAVPDYPQAS